MVMICFFSSLFLTLTFLQCISIIYHFFFQSDTYVRVGVHVNIYTQLHKNIQIFILYILGSSIDSDVQKQSFQEEPRIQTGSN